MIEIKVEESGTWIGGTFIRFDQSMEMIIKAVVAAVEEQVNPSSAASAFASASRILRRNSSSIPVPKVK